MYISIIINQHLDDIGQTNTHQVFNDVGPSNTQQVFSRSTLSPTNHQNNVFIPLFGQASRSSAGIDRVITPAPPISLYNRSTSFQPAGFNTFNTVTQHTNAYRGPLSSTLHNNLNYNSSNSTCTN